MSKRDFIVIDENGLRLDRNECICPGFIDEIISLSNIKNIDYFTYTSAYDVAVLYADNIGYSSDRIHMNHGSEVILKELICKLTDVDTWVVQNPTFELFSFYCQHYGKKIVKCDYQYIDKFRIDIPLTNTSKFGLYIVSPHNPTGDIFSFEELSKFCEYYKYVIVDEAYINPLTKIRQMPNNCIMVRTFSKMAGLTGMRFGVCISNNNIINELNETRPMFLNSITLKMVQCIISNQQLLQKLYNEFDEVKQLVAEQRQIIAATGNFVLLNCDSTYKGYDLKPYIFNDNVFHRLTLSDKQTFLSL